ncbi:MAG TPA: alpha-L-fucosidase [Bryobacteraceae bacterium]|nr:alpha-L-fucosidase [Bryobacteraceae bacterium]
MTRKARVIAVLLLAAAAQNAFGQARTTDDQRFKWWRDARFGMMIHWGLYSVPGGEWKGQTMEYIGEWLMSRFRIPVREYEQLARQFNPVKFDAEAWARTAERAGMRYIVFVSKHHDGFAMFKSAVDPYNIADATPFGRDVMAELSAACRRHNLRWGVYYSQDLDWHEPDGGGTDPTRSLNYGMSWGNNWDFPNHAEKRFERYFNRKSKPQVKELLSNYGPVNIFWFDTPRTISRDQAQELYGMVRTLQPECLVNSRLGQGLGDYGSLGDNMIPVSAFKGAWDNLEAVATMNDTWGYKKSDQNWKSSREVLTLLTGLAGKNINYLLNVGPNALGEFPAPTVKVLNEVGAWMEKNSESVYGTRGSPFAHDLPWGPVTRRAGRLYVHLQDWPQGGKLAIHGLHNRVKKAWLLSQPAARLKFAQPQDSRLGLRVLRVTLPATPPGDMPVLALDIVGDAAVEKGLFQQADGTVTLTAVAAEVHGESAPVSAVAPGQTAPAAMGISRLGAMENWRDPGKWLTWDFKVYKPGAYTVRVITTGLRGRPFEARRKVEVTVAGRTLRTTLAGDEEIRTVATRYHPQHASRCGSIRLDKSGGAYQLALRLDGAAKSINLVSVQLTPDRQ